MFPFIETIDDVLPHIEGNENFKVNRKDDYIIIDYLLNTPECFNNSVEKECRGIIFNSDGTIMSRRLHKFFNLNEREESRIDNVNLDENHWILEKLDGSMITPMISNGKLTWGSKAGVTFLTPQIEEFVEKNKSYKDFALFCLDEMITPIFEWCSHQNRIVIDYPEDRLVLIAMRETHSGKYWSHEDMVSTANCYGINDVVKQYDGTVRSLSNLSDNVKEMTGIEGFVVAFEDGKRIKIKCDEYILYHRAKEDITREKNVIEILINNKADDFRTLLSPFDLIKFEEFEKQFWYNIREKIMKIADLSSKFNCKTMSRKTFSLEFSKNLADYEKSTIFRLYDENVDLTVRRDLVKIEIINIIKKKVGSQTGVDLVRNLWGDLKWNY